MLEPALIILVYDREASVLSTRSLRRPERDSRTAGLRGPALARLDAADPLLLLAQETSVACCTCLCLSYDSASFNGSVIVVGIGLTTSTRLDDRSIYT